jgi:hypothetical protein
MSLWTKIYEVFTHGPLCWRHARGTVPRTWLPQTWPAGARDG